MKFNHPWKVKNLLVLIAIAGAMQACGGPDYSIKDTKISKRGSSLLSQQLGIDSPGVDVLTNRYDNGRTGANISELKKIRQQYHLLKYEKIFWPLGHLIRSTDDILSLWGLTAPGVAASQRMQIKLR